MTRIDLTLEQATVPDTATEPVRVCMPDGSIAGWLNTHLPPNNPGFSLEEIAEAERRTEGPGPWYTTKEVLEHLRALEQTKE